MRSDTEWFLVFSTLILSVLLTLLPMPHIISSGKPVWIALVLIFWSLILPSRLSIVLAWAMGLILDVLCNTVLGEHALALTLTIYLVARFNTRFSMFTLYQQGIGVLLLISFYQFILYCIQGFRGDLPDSWLYGLPALTSMLLWPWVFIIMRDWCRRFEV